MLSDKEKKAIELLEDHLICGNKEGVLYRNLRIISRIIEKQSKEIEHQKEKRENQKKELAILNAKQIEFNKLVNTVNSYKGQFKRKQKELEELKEESKEYQIEFAQEYQIGFAQGCYEKDLDWKDKIKAKIEYLLKRYDSEEDFCSYDVLISILQSLLEKE